MIAAMTAAQDVYAFLSRYRMNPAEIDFVALYEDIIAEMEKGLAGEHSSLEMIPTYIEPGRVMRSRGPVIVIDAGGTNFRSALVRLDP